MGVPAHDLAGQDSCRLAVCHIEVSPEMTTLLGAGPFGRAPLPPDPLCLRFSFATGQPASMEIIQGIAAARPPAGGAEDEVRLFVNRSAFLRIGGSIPSRSDSSAFHLDTTLRTLALSIGGQPVRSDGDKTYRLAKSIELLCETARALSSRGLVPMAAEGALSAEDTRRIVAARQIIDERWSEKLTLDRIARHCGLNRAKLTSGFRVLFGCTIAEALARRRLDQARHMLMTTDKAISSIGYENGYLNNASFARAFARRFGVPPSTYRQVSPIGSR